MPAASAIATPDRLPVIAIVAGEASGDQLGAHLIAALRRHYPTATFTGIGGPRMAAAGFESWYDIDVLSIMGFAEVMRHLPRLLALRRQLVKRLRKLKPDVFIGIDAPDFNLGLERKLKTAGIPVVHYVSPSIWAWREKRAAKIGASADKVLCLFPMEPPIYARHGVEAQFVGHPLAARFPMLSPRDEAREALGLALDRPALAVLPGSRHHEIERLGRIFLDAAQRLRASVPGLQVVVPAANARCRAMLDVIADSLAPASWPAPVDPAPTHAGAPTQPQPAVHIMDGNAHLAMQAADVVLLASGTATLEAMLAKRPMVVGYRVAPTSYHLARWLRLLKTDVFSLPNILARNDNPQAPLPVTELMQDDCTAENLADAVLKLLHDPMRRGEITATFERLHHALLGNMDPECPAEPAAAAIVTMIGHG